MRPAHQLLIGSVPPMQKKKEKDDMVNLFQQGNFILHSGRESFFRIECAALTDADWETLALLVARRFDFRKVIGIPRGGEKFAKALEKYCDSESQVILIVDDVLTTGQSMKEEQGRQQKEGITIKGVVVFLRGCCPLWVWSIFQMESWRGI